MVTSHPSHAAQRRGALLLALTTLLWGTTFIALKLALPATPPAVITLGRFLIAAAALSPLLRHARSLRLWLVGLELGFWLTLGYGVQVVGLQYTSVGRSAFITTLHVIFVPMIGVALRRRPGGLVWMMAALAFVGTGLLCYDGSRPNLGDLWTVVCAMAWAIYILRLEALSPRWPALALTVVQVYAVAALCMVWALLDGTLAHTRLASLPWSVLVYLGLVATALTTWLQVAGQRHISAPRAAVIFTMEPVWACLFAFVIFGDRLGPQGLAGAGLIVAATLLVQRPARPRSSAEAPASCPLGAGGVQDSPDREPSAVG